MTEDEMKQTWCPDARVISINMSAGNRPHPQGGHTPEFRAMCLCLGRACSAWRWERVPNPAYAEWARARSGSGMFVIDWTAAPPESIRNTTDGYCGRAGVP